jgi:predicted DNA-binding transcriptional regulator AlpA
VARIERRRAAHTRLGVGKTTFDENYVDKGGESYVPGTNIPRLRPVPLGARAIGFFSDEIDSLIEALRRFRDTTPSAAPKPAIDLALRRRRRTDSKPTRKSTVEKIRPPEPMSRRPEVRNSQSPSVGGTSKRDTG